MISRERYLQYYFLFIWRVAKWVVTLCIIFWALMLMLEFFYLAHPSPTIHYGWGAVVTEICLIAVLVAIQRFLGRAIEQKKQTLHEQSTT